MSEMIERIALKLGITKAIVRAVIAEMREPTEAIINAHHVVPDDNDFDQRAADNWRNLVDVMLKAE